MKRLMSLLLTGIFIMTVVLSALPAGAIGQTMSVKYGTPVIDGSIDKIWYQATRTRLMNVTAGKDFSGKLPGSSVAYVSVLYDDEAIYFLFEVFDNDFTFDADGKYKNDCINLFIDEKDVYGKTWQDGQRMIQLVPNGDDPIKTVHGKAPKYSKIGYKQESNGYTIEYKYVPSDFVIEDGAQLLVDFAFCDIDENGELSYYFIWSDEIGEGEIDSSNWAYLALGGAGSKQSSGAKEAAESIGVTPIKNYEFVNGTNGNPNESADKLWDGNVETKFCTGDFPLYSVIKCTQPYFVTGVLMATANDTKEYEGRNPKSWKIDGSNDGKKWTTIISGDDSFFENVNFTYFATTVESDESYSYFRFYSAGAESGCFQLSEVTICGTTDKSANTAKETEAAEEVPGGTIVEQKSSEYEKEIKAEEIVASGANNSGNSDGSWAILAATVVFLGAAVAVIIYVQSSPKKKK